MKKRLNILAHSDFISITNALIWKWLTNGEANIEVLCCPEINFLNPANFFNSDGIWIVYGFAEEFNSKDGVRNVHDAKEGLKNLLRIKKTDIEEKLTTRQKQFVKNVINGIKGKINDDVLKLLYIYRCLAIEDIDEIEDILFSDKKKSRYLTYKNDVKMQYKTKKVLQHPTKKDIFLFYFDELIGYDIIKYVIKNKYKGNMFMFFDGKTGSVVFYKRDGSEINLKEYMKYINLPTVVDRNECYGSPNDKFIGFVEKFTEYEQT